MIGRYVGVFRGMQGEIKGRRCRGRKGGRKDSQDKQQQDVHVTSATSHTVAVALIAAGIMKLIGVPDGMDDTNSSSGPVNMPRRIIFQMRMNLEPMRNRTEKYDSRTCLNAYL